MKLPRLTTKRLILRQIEMKDASRLVEQINNLEISKWLLAVPYPYKNKDALWWINHCREKNKEKPRKSYEYLVELKSELGIIGGFGISSIKYDQGTADLGYWLGEDYWGKGYATEGVSRLIDYAFKDLKLRRLKIPAFATNPASNALAKKLGFTYEGRLRKAVICKATGKIHDENIWGLLRSEWRKK
jgi:RimJ/RimL family protein N-acetyltransferase